MKSHRLLPLLAAFGGMFAAAPALADDHAAETVLPAGPEGPALWQIADEDTTIYLFGTIHALPADVAWYDAEIDAALASADTVVTELLMDPESEAAMQRLAIESGAFTDGTTLRSLLDEEQAAAYEGALGKLGIPPAAFDRLEPWLAGLTLTMLPLIQQGYDLEAGVDKVILAKSRDAARGALETAEFQLAIFDSLPQEAQIEFLMAAVEGSDEVKPTLDAMVAEWVEGDAEGLAEVMNEDMDEDETLAQKLLYDRNANWAEWIEERMDEPGTVFVAVGAGHLAGPRSVQEFLAERGFESTRVQ